MKQAKDITVKQHDSHDGCVNIVLTMEDGEECVMHMTAVNGLRFAAEIQATGVVELTLDANKQTRGFNDTSDVPKFVTVEDGSDLEALLNKLASGMGDAGFAKDQEPVEDDKDEVPPEDQARVDSRGPGNPWGKGTGKAVMDKDLKELAESGSRDLSKTEE